ncbi:hypothetical protein KP509_08G043500 [Ceratopteris richardii]|uniref:CASP-like protein n=1 Tax=Ceratopteris richardii TaxID=49495 RepID=A0A8T2UFW9_CERRI|nr:hypothetical protein KP509_08G043500 [Ceratopteris richardii]
MGSSELADRGRAPFTPEHSSPAAVAAPAGPVEGGNGKVVHYYGRGFGDAPNDVSAGRLSTRAASALLVMRFLSMAFSLASLLVMVTNKSTHLRPHSVKWTDVEAYRYVLAADAIVCLYSFAEIGLGFWNMIRGRMLMPETMAHWFDFGHDQGFAYLIFSACSAGTAVARNLRKKNILILGIYACDKADSFCQRAEISIGLGYGAFVFIALSSLITGYRLAKWLMSAS